MRFRSQSGGHILTFGPETLIGEGGEARILRVPQHDRLVAKIYHRLSEERGVKLAAMLAAPPEEPDETRRHRSIAWPCDLLLSTDGSSRVAGFLMPFVAGMRTLIDFYHPKTRRRQHPLFDYRYLLRTGRNLAAAFGALHARGYVIGDVNESNILAATTALVTLVDTDSFQVPDGRSGAFYRCPVGKPEFTPPELQGKHFGSVDRLPEHDLFGLGVLLFQLLMEGAHPFAGQFIGEGDPPITEDRIVAGHFPHSRGGRAPYRPAPLAPPLAMLAPDVQSLFRRCFEDGHRDPRARPEAHAWQHVLTVAEEELVTCPLNEHHRYGPHLSGCPWCERAARLGGLDPFPSREAVRQGLHLRPLVPARPKPLPIVRPVPRASARLIPRLAFTAPRPAGSRRPLVPVPRGRSPILRWPLYLLFFIPAVVSMLLSLSDRHGDFRAVIARRAPAEIRASPLIEAVRPPLQIEVFKPGEPWTNGLGMEFVPVPGTKVVFSKWDTRVCDYTVFVEANGRPWPKPSFQQGPTHPAVNVSWDDAEAFCLWLTKKERQSRTLGSSSEYRLPTDLEWSLAVKLDDEPGRTPEQKSQAVVGVYPWGIDWPPPRNSANYEHALYVDDYPCTSPVGVFPANGYGLFDLGGNVAQWCEDEFFPRSGRRVVRGAGWDASRKETLLASHRDSFLPGARYDTVGFRCVVATEGSVRDPEKGLQKP